MLGMSQHISREDVAHVAQLARLRLTDEELDLFTGQLAAVLELDGVSVDDVHPRDRRRLQERRHRLARVVVVAERQQVAGHRHDRENGPGGAEARQERPGQQEDRRKNQQRHAQLDLRVRQVEAVDQRRVEQVAVQPGVLVADSEVVVVQQHPPADRIGQQA